MVLHTIKIKILYILSTLHYYCIARVYDTTFKTILCSSIPTQLHLFDKFDFEKKYNGIIIIMDASKIMEKY